MPHSSGTPAHLPFYLGAIYPFFPAKFHRWHNEQDGPEGWPLLCGRSLPRLLPPSTPAGTRFAVAVEIINLQNYQLRRQQKQRMGEPGRRSQRSVSNRSLLRGGFSQSNDVVSFIFPDRPAARSSYVPRPVVMVAVVGVR